MGKKSWPMELHSRPPRQHVATFMHRGLKGTWPHAGLKVHHMRMARTWHMVNVVLCRCALGWHVYMAAHCSCNTSACTCMALNTNPSDGTRMFSMCEHEGVGMYGW